MPWYESEIERRKLKIKELVSPLNKGGLRGDLLLSAAFQVPWDKSPQPPLLRGASIGSWTTRGGQGA